MEETHRGRAVLAFCSVVVVAAFDYLTGPDIALSFFYLVPVLLVAWELGLKAGVALAIVSAGLFPVPDVLRAGGPEPWVAFWNFAVQGASFVTATLLADRLKRALGAEQAMARTDPLTKVSNPRWFRTEAEREIERARRYDRPLSIAFLDLDNFKTVNDRWGHSAGDDLLTRVGAVLTSSTRILDVLGRVGGDEFAILMPDTDEGSARVVAERLRDLLEAEFSDTPFAAAVTFSVGIVTSRGPKETFDELLSEADRLMYSAKGAGKACVRSRELSGEPSPVER